MKVKYRANFLYSLMSLIAMLLWTNIVAQGYQIGKINTTFTDATRNNRQVPVAIYYPADVAGNAVPFAPGEFPVISFGHGFVMVHSAYQFLWEALVPSGYIVAFPLTE